MLFLLFFLFAVLFNHTEKKGAIMKLIPLKHNIITTQQSAVVMQCTSSIAA